MAFSKKYSIRALIVLVTLFSWSAAGAVSFQEEYAKRVNGGESVSAYDGGLFGDSLSMATGAVEFSATDVSLPGNDAIPVAFGRRRSIDIGREPTFAMGDWDLDIPFMEGVFGAGQGWIVDTAQPTQRCSSPGISTMAPPYLGEIQPSKYWQGIHLQTPGGARQEVLFKNASVSGPSGEPRIYRYVTSGSGSSPVRPRLQADMPVKGLLPDRPME